MKSVAITDVGRRREINQDYVYCNNDAVGLLPNLYIVADGMGGHKAGDFASRFCVTEFEKEVREQNARTIIGSMEGALRLTNERLLKEAENEPDLEGMGTTFVAATIVEKTVFVANVGDSRLYIINKKGTIRQITQDHSRVEEMILRGEISRKEAKHHPKRNEITRAVGAFEQVQPDFFEVEAEDGEYILLCSDGLTNMLEDDEIAEVIARMDAELSQKAEKLITLANENGGRDNISLVLVQI